MEEAHPTADDDKDLRMLDFDGDSRDLPPRHDGGFRPERNTKHQTPNTKQDIVKLDDEEQLAACNDRVVVEATSEITPQPPIRSRLETATCGSKPGRRREIRKPHKRTHKCQARLERGL